MRMAVIKLIVVAAALFAVVAARVGPRFAFSRARAEQVGPFIDAVRSRDANPASGW